MKYIVINSSERLLDCRAYLKFNDLKLQLQRTMSNYDKLFDELTDLIGDQEVLDNLDYHLKSRIQNLLQNRNLPKNQPISIFGTDSQLLFKDVQLRSPPNHFNLTDYSNALKPTKKTNLNSAVVITDKKTSEITLNSNKALVKVNKNTSRQKLLCKNQSKASCKNVIKYSTLVADRSKSKQKPKPKGVNESSTRCLKIANKSKSKQKGMNLYEKTQKQNLKALLPHQVNHQLHKKKKQVAEFIHLVTPQLKIKPKHSKTNQSREILKRLATLQTEPSTISFHSNIAEKSTDALSYQAKSIQKRPISKRSMDKRFNETKTVGKEEELTIFEVIHNKQQALNDQRSELEYRVKQLSQLIQNEKAGMEEINQNITKMCLQINKQENIQKNCSVERKLSRKKSENYFNQARLIEQQLIEFSKNKELIASNIEQQNYLINMYLKVIEEMRSQLKIEQSQKIELTKKLVVLSRAQKMSAKKYGSKQALNNQYFTNMHESLSKWLD